MFVIEEIIDNWNHRARTCKIMFSSEYTFKFYDSITNRHTIISGDFAKIARYINENNVLCTIKGKNDYYTMSKEAVKLYSSEIVNYLGVRASTSKPKFCITAISSDNLFVDVEFNQSYHVGTNVYDLLIDGVATIDSEGIYTLNSLFSTLELTYDIKDKDYLTKLITKRKILAQL